jgi:deazaflavin-dependent oxidoreductase (nitroreductase family)
MMAGTTSTQVPRIASWVNRRTKGRPTPAAFLRFHRWLYLKSGGHFGHGLIGAPCLVLTTTGRRSAVHRSTVLVYAREDDRYVVAASNDGLDRDPSWLLNVRAEPNVKLQVGCYLLDGTARVVERSDPDYSRLWSTVNTVNHDRYDSYQAKTSRPIPLVIVEATDPHTTMG